jgi:hypothetical protein
MEPLTLVVPTFNEAETIDGVIREIPVAYRLDIIVADGGSTDGVIHHRQVWGWMTSAFALTQAAGGWGFSFLFTETASYPLLFVVGAGTLMVGAVFALASRWTQTRCA